MIHWSIFNSLPLEEKGKLLYKTGIVVSRVRTEGHYIALYRMESFYVELCFNGGLRKVESITALSAQWLRPLAGKTWTNSIETLINVRKQQLCLSKEHRTGKTLAKDFLIKGCPN